MAQPPDRPPGPDEDETVIRDEWGREREVFVEQRTEEEVVEGAPRQPPKIWPWLLALLVLVLGGLGALWYFTQEDEDDAAETTATVARTAPVPDVVGTTSSEATATLREAGFEANVVAVPSEAPAGQVIAQDPAPGDRAEEGSSVRLNVARPSEQTTPATTEAATTEATTTAETTTQATTTQGTTTQATTTAPPEPAPATVPDAIGAELADAARSFADEGLRASVVYVPSREARGTVVAQAQPAGTELREGDTVQLNASTGADPPADVSVPDVEGLERNDARERLDQAGFEVLALEVDEGEEGEVVVQSPSGGASIPRGSLVLLYVGD